MKKTVLLSVVFILAVVIIAIPLLAQTKKQTTKTAAKKASCLSCHENTQSILPKNHKPVSGDTIASCNPCHKPDLSGKAEPRPYAGTLHRAHVKEGSTADCMICHTYKGGRLGISGTGVSLGKVEKEDLENTKKIFLSWSQSKNMDGIHGKVDIMCSACHGNKLATTGDTVENDRCLTCHGPLEALQKRSEPKDFPDRNPHNSHLGDIACTVCHKAHSPSTVYCLGCHGNFKMKIPGAEPKG